MANYIAIFRSGYRRAGWKFPRTSCAVLLLYGIVALALMAPMASNSVMPGSISVPDHAIQVGFIIQARMALEQGQFPLRVAPVHHSGHHYPFYQFYGQLPYTVTALIYKYLTPSNPFMAYKIALWAALVFGAFFVYRGVRTVSDSRPACILAGLVYMTAPYLLINVHPRGGFTEVVGQALLAAVIYYTLRCYASPRLRWIVAAALAWAALGTSHLVTFIWSIPFIGLLLLLSGRRKRATRLGRAFTRMCLGLAACVVLPGSGGSFQRAAGIARTPTQSGGLHLDDANHLPVVARLNSIRAAAGKEHVYRHQLQHGLAGADRMRSRGSSAVAMEVRKRHVHSWPMACFPPGGPLSDRAVPHMVSVRFLDISSQNILVSSVQFPLFDPHDVDRRVHERPGIVPRRQTPSWDSASCRWCVIAGFRCQFVSNAARGAPRYDRTDESVS